MDKKLKEYDNVQLHVGLQIILDYGKKRVLNEPKFEIVLRKDLSKLNFITSDYAEEIINCIYDMCDLSSEELINQIKKM